MNSNLMDENKDDEMNKRTYQAVMDFSTKLGVPVALGLTVFFTSLVMALGVFPALFYGVVTIIAVYFIVKMFFTH